MNTLLANGEVKTEWGRERERENGRDLDYFFQAPLFIVFFNLQTFVNIHSY